MATINKAKLNSLCSSKEKNKNNVKKNSKVLCKGTKAEAVAFCNMENAKIMKIYHKKLL